MGEGTDYIVTVSNGSTTIQVISGSVIFVDKYTNNSLTIVANQMLALPSGVHTGFSQQDLQDSLSAFDASSINQWWTQIQTTPTSTPSKITTATATPTTNSENGNLNFLSQPMFLTAIILVVIIVIIAVLIATRRKTHSRQHSTCKQNSPKPVNDETPKPISPITEIPPPPSPESENNQQKRAFCPNCGNKLLHPKDFCPFCGSNLRQ
jgi:preprotein translocase subunit SecG